MRELTIKAFGPPGLIDQLKSGIEIIVFGQSMWICSECGPGADASIYISKAVKRFSRDFSNRDMFRQGAEEYLKIGTFSTPVSIAGVELFAEAQPGCETEYEITLVY